MNDIDLQDRQQTWEQLIENKKLLSGSKKKYYIKKIKKFLPDKYSEIMHTNHMRSMLRYCINKFGTTPIVGCEVGVADGKHAFNMCYHLNMSKLYLVDAWNYYDGLLVKEKNYVYKKDEEYQKQTNKQYERCKNRLKRFDEKCKYIKKYSHEAVNNIHDKLDFCYLDANHTYSYVKKDIECYYPLIKEGGVLGGHDFSPVTPNVARAVIEFANNNGLRICGISPTDWWIIKNPIVR